MRARLFEEYITVPFNGQSHRFCFASRVLAVKQYYNVYMLSLRSAMPLLLHIYTVTLLFHTCPECQIVLQA